MAFAGFLVWDLDEAGRLLFWLGAVWIIGGTVRFFWRLGKLRKHLLALDRWGNFEFSVTGLSKKILMTGRVTCKLGTTFHADIC